MPTDYLYWQRGKISNCQMKAGFTICGIAPPHRIALPHREESTSIFRAPHDSALRSGAYKFTYCFSPAHQFSGTAHAQFAEGLHFSVFHFILVILNIMKVSDCHIYNICIDKFTYFGM